MTSHARTSFDVGETAVDLPLRVEPQLVLVLSGDAPLESSVRVLLGDVCEITVGRGAHRRFAVSAAGRDRRLHIDLIGECVSAMHARFVRIDDEWYVEDADSKNGTFVDGVPISDRTQLADGAVIEIGGTFFVYRIGSVYDDRWIVSDADLVARAREFVTYSGMLADSYEKLARSVDGGSHVVKIVGDIHARKAAARALHRLSKRPGPLAETYNLVGLSENDVAALLFGYWQGPASADDAERGGLLYAARDGSLILEDMGKLPHKSQLGLRYAIKNRRHTPLGVYKPVPLATLFIATMDDGDQSTFWEDLEVNSPVCICIPHLVERREDTGLILRELAAELPSDVSARIVLSLPAARALFLHGWPSDVSSLRSALRSAIAWAAGSPISCKHLGLEALPEYLRVAKGSRSGTSNLEW